MEDRCLKLYKEILTEAVASDDYESVLRDSIRYMVKEESESVAVNFVLYHFYTLDKVSAMSVHRGFKTNTDREIYLRMMSIEADLEFLYGELGYKELFVKAINTYKTAIGNA